MSNRRVSCALVFSCAFVFGVGLAASAAVSSENPDDRVVLGSGRHTYEWVKDWLKLPEGMANLGPTHGGIVVDAKNRIYVSTDTDNSIVMLDQDGKWLGAWGKDLHGGLHGLVLHIEKGEKGKEGAQEFLYAAHVSAREVVKLTLDGKLLWRVGYPKESGIYQDPNQYAPTGVAVLADGSFVVADGYGTSWLHLFDKDQKYVKSFGGGGTEPGKFRTCHGLCVDARAGKPLLLIADRENARLQHFDLAGNLVKVHDQELRRPCLASVANGGGDVVVPDLAGRVTIFDKDMKLVCHLGDNPVEGLRANFNVDAAQQKPGCFTAPHGAAWDHDGNLYVQDWNMLGRVTKLQRIKPKD